VLGVERGSYTIKLSAAGFEDAQQLVLVNAAWGVYVSGMYSESIAQCYFVGELERSAHW